MSSFLETNTGPGQKTLSAFLKKDSDDSAAKPALLQQFGGNQTVLGQETHEELANRMQEQRMQHAASLPPGNVSLSGKGTGDAATAQEVYQDPFGAGPATSSQTKERAEAPAVSEAGPAEEDATQSLRAPEPSQATEAGSQPPLELTLRDWQGSTASQPARTQLALSQQARRAEHSQHAGQSSLRLAPHGQRQSRQQSEQNASSAGDAAGAAEDHGGDLSTCRDVLDTAEEAGGPDLAHAWEEEPAGIGDEPGDASLCPSQSAGARAASGSRTWTCQVSRPSATCITYCGIPGT